MIAALISLPNTFVSTLSDALTPLAKQAKTPPVRLSSNTQRSAADRVLAAADRDDLADRLDEEFKTLSEWDDAPAPHPKLFDPSAIDSKSLDLSSLRFTLGDANAEACALGFEAMKAFLRDLTNLMAITQSLAPQLAALRSDDKTPVSWFEMLVNPALPLSFRQGLLAVERSLAATFVIGRAEELGKRTEPWLAHALTEHFATGFIQLSKLPEKVRNLAAIQKDLQLEQMNQARFAERLAAWRKEADALGLQAYYPLDQPD